MVNILVVDDEKSFRRSLCIALEEWEHKTAEAASGAEAIQLITKDVFDVVLTDLVMEEMDGIDVLREVKKLSPYTEVLLMSAHGTIAKAVEAMQQGAFDFIVKPFTMDHLDLVLKKLLGQMELKQTVKYLKAVLADHYLLDDIIAVSPGMQEVMHQVSLVAHWTVPVLIQGESGVGKELVAMAIHHLGERSSKPFIPINCGAFSETLLDSELFGHSKGAFTGAISNKRGLIEEANGGTLFLDEIGEAPNALQVRLLRFLDNGRFRRVGEVQERESVVRVLAATNKDPKLDIENKKFREDLYYRLSVAVIDIPPLRDRREDIPSLCQRFLHSDSWPGNVRELENTIEHALIVARTDEIQISDLPPRFQKIERKNDDLFINGNQPLEEVVRGYILAVLNKTDGNKKKAAEILKISRTTLISRLKSYGITRQRSKM